MELYQLRTFIAVAEEGNLTKAAERIYASQPAVSAHIKALEEELGLPLFVRTPRGMQLTDVGKGLKLKADTILLAADDMVNQAKSYREELTGTLKIALNTDPEFLRVNEVIGSMAEGHPKLQLRLLQSSSGVILKDVRDRRLDAGFTFFDNPYAEVTAIKLREIPVRVVAPAAWSAKVEGKSIDQLATMPWVKPDMDCPFMKIIEGVFEDSGIMMTDYIEADSEDVIRGLVAAGRGLSLLKQDDADAMVKEGSVVICDAGPILSLSISFVYAKTRENDPLIRALADVVGQIWDSEQGEGVCSV
ncbi:LysR family transcriptional regulator [Pseudodesulfovibrio sp.]|nr:LysR family transcriptional regulator [Pseudodesulfovibrio sp.]